MSSDGASLNSMAATPKPPKTPQVGGKKQVGFARPTLIIPPPQGLATPSPYSANLSVNSSLNQPNRNNMYGRKASVFMFDQFHGIRDFTMSTAKSGIGGGEKCAFWMYNKISSWSRKWFTHCFLSIVIVLYTIGGALVFVAIEGQNEEKIVERDIRKDRYELIRDLRNLSLVMPSSTSLGEWEGEAVRKLLDFEAKVIDAYQKNALIVANRGEKIWTFWNSIVYCGTIYTTIDNITEQNGFEPAEKDINRARIEALVTAEQVLSDSVARRRRKFTKKRSTSLTRREPTPVRQLDDDKVTTTSDEDVPPRKPKTPERKRKKVNKRKSYHGTDSEPGIITEPDEEFLLTRDVKKTNSIPKQFPLGEDEKKRVSLTDMAQTEVMAFFNKTKKSISAAATRGRDRFRRHNKEQVKRSQSAPHQFTEEELIESFNKAQLLSVDYVPTRKYSDSSLRSLTPDIPFEPKPFRPEVQEFVRQRRKQREYSTRIVEILDPKTSDVISRKSVVRSHFKLGELFTVLRTFSVIEIYRNYKAYKVEMKEEYQRIRVLWNKCMIELLLIMVFCGIGGMIFKFTEGTFENFYKCGVKRVKRDFLDQLWVKSHNLREEDWKSLARSKLRFFEEELHAAHEAGMTSYSGQRSWSFLNAVVYALTIITTIGYGHMYPTTITGRALTIVYSIIGIPLFLIALTDFGKLFTRCIKFVWSFVRRVYYTGSCRQARKTAHVSEIFKGAQMMYDLATFRRPSTEVLDEENANAPSLDAVSHLTAIEVDTPTSPVLSNYEIDDEFNLPISVAIFILVLYIFMGALIYCMWEHWDFFASFYFVFISMSTIGFGDYVPRHPICMIVSIVYLVFGLALMSMCINVVQCKLSDTFRQASAKIGASIGLTVAEDDGSMLTIPPEHVDLPNVHNEVKQEGKSASPTEDKKEH